MTSCHYLLQFFFPHPTVFTKQKPSILVLSAKTTGNPVLSHKRFAGRHQDSIKLILNIIQQANEYLDQAEKSDRGWNKVGRNRRKVNWKRIIYVGDFSLSKKLIFSFCLSQKSLELIESMAQQADAFLVCRRLSRFTGCWVYLWCLV